MYRIRRDIKFSYNEATDVFTETDREIVNKKLDGLTLMEAIRKQGYFVSDVFRELRTTLFGQYPKMLAYCKCRTVIDKTCDDVKVWYDIKQACDRLHIEWDGWKDLPELPDDDDF